MVEAELEFAPELKRLFPQATPRARPSWSIPLQNGRSHMCRASIGNDVLILTTGLLGISAFPQTIMAMNTSLPASSRIVCTVDGLRLRTERALQGDATFSRVCEAAMLEFQFSLDVFGGASTPIPASRSIFALETEDPAPHWNARENGDGTWSVPLIEHRAVLMASPLFVKAYGIPQDGYPEDVRSALAEYLLRVTSQVLFVKACATPDSDTNWTGWLQASPCVCGMDEALTSVFVAHRESASAARALSEVRIAQRFREIGSIWGAGAAPISQERR